MKMLSNMNREQASPPLLEPTGPVFFVIQRPTYPDWFAGWNVRGPTWTSNYDDACRVRLGLLVSYMQNLAKHKPFASLSPNNSAPHPRGDGPSIAIMAGM